MKRSHAPSAISANKRKKFVPPFASSPTLSSCPPPSTSAGSAAPTIQQPLLNGQSHDRHVTNGASHDVSVPLHYDNGDDDDGSYEVAGASVRPEDLSHPFDVSFETSTDKTGTEDSSGPAVMFKPPATGTEDSSLHAVMFKPPATGIEDSSLHAVMFKPPATGSEDSSLHAVMFKPPATGTEDSSLHAVMFKPPATGTEDSSLHAVMFKPPATGTEDSSRMFKPPAKRSSSGFRVPVNQSGNTRNMKIAADIKEEATTSYYQVMWCKHSKKKHKKWEGDAILMTRGRTATLMDTEGKMIGKGSGYKLTELAALGEGNTLVIGGKEIEVMGTLSDEDWKSGKCFTGAVTPCRKPTGGPAAVQSAALRKPFFIPSLGGAERATPAVVTPLHDPTLPNSLVMPRPTPQHQLEHNSGGLQVVDVVVDPHLSRDLRPHQREGVVFLYECVMSMRDYVGSGTILADEMGLGKTLQCITLLWTLIKQGPYGRKPVARRIIIITPGSLVKNWEKEFSKWLGNERLLVYAVSSEHRAEEFLKSSKYPVMIISYEMFLRSYDVLKSAKFDLIVCDEGHRLKNNSTKTTSLITSLPSLKRIVLTGTPIQNDLQEFYSIVEFCNPGMLGSCGAFHRVYEQPIVAGKEPTATAEEKEISSKRADELHRLISQFFLRRTQEVNNQYLPPKVEAVVFCSMSPLQVSLYTHLARTQLTRLQGRRTNDMSQHLVCIGTLKKVCNSPTLLYTAAKASPDPTDENLVTFAVLPLFPAGFSATEVDTSQSGKLEVLFGILDYLFTHTREKMVVVSNYTQTLNLLERVCDVRSYKFLRLDGSTPSSKRFQLVEHFNSPHSPQMVFLLSSKAGGVGLNLIGASRLILYDIDWNPANDLQAMARVWRDGQKRKVYIYRLLTTGSIEEKIYQRQIRKSGLAEVMEAGAGTGTGTGQGTVKFSSEELKDLYRLRTETVCDTHDLLECACTHMDLPGASTVATKDLQRNIAMGELLEWQHFSQPIQDSGLTDIALLQASNRITFIFQSEANADNTDC